MILSISVGPADYYYTTVQFSLNNKSPNPAARPCHRVAETRRRMSFILTWPPAVFFLSVAHLNPLSNDNILKTTIPINRHNPALISGCDNL